MPLVLEDMDKGCKLLVNKYHGRVSAIAAVRNLTRTVNRMIKDGNQADIMAIMAGFSGGEETRSDMLSYSTK